MSTNPPRVPVKERIVFNSSVEALLIRGLAKQMTPELAAGLKELGFDLSKPLLPGYPSDQWQKAVDLCAKLVFPNDTMGDAQWKLGESTVMGFEETLIGKAAIGFSKVLGPRRIMGRFPSMSRTSNNFSRMEGKEISPTHFEMTTEPYVGWPQFVQGCLSAVLRISGAKEPNCEIVEHDPKRERLVLSCTWKA
jgi:uncharacterized protein (TIGR02265 family)